MSSSLTLTETSPIQTFSEPLSLAEVKGRLRMATSDTSDDALLNLYRPAAREVAEIFQGRDLVRKQWDLSLDGFDSDPIELRERLYSVDLVRYRASDSAYTTLTENTDYIVDTARQPGILMPAYGESWPSFTAWPSGAVLIRFTAGLSPTDVFWSDAGQRLKVGMLNLIWYWYAGGLPFDLGNKDGMLEYPFAVTSLLSFGANPRVV